MKKILVNIGFMFGVCFIFSLTNNLLQNNFQFNQVSVIWSLGYALVPLAVVLFIAGIISAVVWLFKKKLWEELIPFMWIAIIFVEITTLYSLTKKPPDNAQSNLSKKQHASEIVSSAVREYQDGKSSVDSLTNIKHLYSLLVNDWSGFNVPFEEFAKDMLDEATLKNLHSNLQKEYSWFTIPYSRFSSEISESIEKAGIHNYEEEIVELTKAIEVNPRDAEAYHKRGFAKANLRDFRGSILDYNKSIELNSNNSEVYENRALSKLWLDDYHGSIADYTKAIAINPKSPEAYYCRGLAKISLDMKESACLDFSRAGELGYKDAYSTIAEKCN